MREKQFTVFLQNCCCVNFGQQFSGKCTNKKFILSNDVWLERTGNFFLCLENIPDSAIMPIPQVNIKRQYDFEDLVQKITLVTTRHNATQQNTTQNNTSTTRNDTRQHKYDTGQHDAIPDNTSAARDSTSTKQHKIYFDLFILRCILGAWYFRL